MADDLINGEETEILWADVREKLGISVSTLRSIRQRFGSLLGLSGTKKVSSKVIPTIQLINSLRNSGVEDHEIEKELLKGRDEEGWPDEILRRIQSRASGNGQDSESFKPYVEVQGNLYPESENASLKAASLDEVIQAGREAAPSATYQLYSSLERSEKEDTLHENGEPLLPSELSVLSADQGKVDIRILNMFLDLRREMATHEYSQKAEIQRLHCTIEKLYQEVRSLRYALILSEGRKKRKSGSKSGLRLLL